ncbi:GIN domain-containing protein [Anaeromyxobacter terrae]|uniref:GIN domain-containing protein n=1 Tax=Anaeromyxobacter terrae TaxID=2925406 RepID=UPI001F5603A4|nr:DUF2807 domain-containing protein [Anaeromyxobacter sp. SG22]
MNAGAHLLGIPQPTSYARAPSAVPGRAAAARHRRHLATPARRSPACRAAALLSALLAGLVLACDPYVKGNGVLREETRQVGAFEGLRVEDGIQAQLTAGASAQHVTVSGDENLLQHISTAVKADPLHGQVLEVRSTLSSFDSTHPIRVVVSVPVLRFLAATDGCYVTASGAAADAFAVDADDGADVRLGGTGGAELSVRLAGGQRGGAHLDAREYRVTDASVDLSASARAELRVDQRVTGTLSGAAQLENVGAGACEVTATADATVSCLSTPP